MKLKTRTDMELQCHSFLSAVFLMAWGSSAAEPKITLFTPTGHLGWTNGFSNGVCTIEVASSLLGPWQPKKNLFATKEAGEVALPVPDQTSFYRLLSVDISADVPEGFNNLADSYSILETVAGKGELGLDGFNYWQGRFEGVLAT